MGGRVGPGYQADTGCLIAAFFNLPHWQAAFYLESFPDLDSGLNAHPLWQGACARAFPTTQKMKE